MFNIISYFMWYVEIEEATLYNDVSTSKASSYFYEISFYKHTLQ